MVTVTKEVEVDGSAESGKGGRNFKSSPDVEAFYRLVHDNGLRREARMILDAIQSRLKELSKRKKKRGRKKLQ